MRKIEQAMNTAIANSTNWQSGNTSVHFNEEEQVSVVRLHGNKIAEVGEGFIRLFDGGWQTNTTKSRLNAILAENGADNDKVFPRTLIGLFKWTPHKVCPLFLSFLQCVSVTGHEHRYSLHSIHH